MSADAGRLVVAGIGWNCEIGYATSINYGVYGP